MAADNNNIESNYKKLVNSLYQYLSEPIKDFSSIKPEIINILKTHRPIRVVDYQYGISSSFKGRSRLIIHEFNDRSMVREYFKSGKNDWHCCECNRTAASKANESGINDILIQHGIVFVKNEHDCKPRNISFVKQIQKLYQEKKIDEAISLQKSVLGSEDSLNQNAVEKSGKTSSKKQIIDEIRVQYAKLNDIDALGGLTDKQLDDNEEEKLAPEAAFAKIIGNLNEYTNEDVDLVLSHKSKLISILETHRPIKSSNVQLGFSQNLQNNKRIIVFEWAHTTKVRDYTKKKGDNMLWVCLECYNLYSRRRLKLSYSYLYFVYGIVFVPYDHECHPRDYKLVLIYQRFLQGEDTAKARAMVRYVSFAYGQDLQNLNALNDISCTLPEDTFNKKSVNDNEIHCKNSKRKLIYDKEIPLRKKSKINKSALDDTVMNEDNLVLFNEEPMDQKKLMPNNITTRASFADADTSTVDNSGNDMSQKKLKRKKNISSFEEPSASVNDILHYEKLKDSNEKPKYKKVHVNEDVSSDNVNEEKENQRTIFAYGKPSTSKFEEICSKLNIGYRNNATRLWDNITFDQIDTVKMPKNIKTQHFITENFYEILSKYFTGKSKQHEKIKTTIIDALRENMVSSGEISSKKFEKEYLDTVTDEHLSFIAKFISCRILIFDGEEGIKKFGKWKRHESKRLTLVFSFVDDFYSIVLSF